MAEKKKSKGNGATKSPKSTGKAARSTPAAKPTAAGKPVAGAGSTNKAPATKKKEAPAARREASRALRKPEARKTAARQKRKSTPEKEGEKAAEECGAAPRPRRFPIAAVGASAGGLEALKEFFGPMPAEAGMAFVVVTHQHPGHVSLLPDILGRSTKLPVVEVSERTRIEPNRIYLGTPGELLSIRGGVLRVLETEEAQAPHLPIDHFFRSLAADQREQAVCVVLSGTGGDGTVGLKSVKAEAGLVMVQAPQSAKYASMPSSAQATGLADYVLPPREMAEQLLAYIRGPYLQKPRIPVQADEEGMVSLPREPQLQILGLLKRRTGHDFSQYKAGTIQRRIERRMNLHQIQRPSLYFGYLKENPREIDLLLSELLISVTSFFRDPKAFEALASVSIPRLIKAHHDDEHLRVWVVGCATGEEAYAMAILLHECLETSDAKLDVQVFATDLDEHAVYTARQGRYPAGIRADVSTERLEKYFHREDNFYQVRKVIRDMIVFAPQNVTRDPPFTRLDLIVCRNLLIYLDVPLQRRVLELFHYALRSGGHLFLGPSETLGRADDLFKALDGKWKVFEKKDAKQPIHPVLEPPYRGGGLEGVRRAGGEVAEKRKSRTTQEIERLLLSRFAPASLVVDGRGDILYIHGRTGDYLEPSSGEQRGSNVLEMAREGLRALLTAGLRQAAAQGLEVIRRQVRVRTNSKHTFVDVSVTPIEDPAPLKGTFLIALRPSVQCKGVKKGKGKSDAEEVSIDQGNLEQELQYTKESLQTTIEEMETSNEELKSSNEELQSTNEELASTNEELETSKEELQSLNEELSTVNAELNSKVDELARLNDDMQNLLNSTNVATIFLDQDLNVKRYTEKAKELFNLIASDVGRPLEDLASQFDHQGLYADCEAVLRDLAAREREIRSPGGRSYLMKIMPYRTVDNVIDGVVLTFMEFSRLGQTCGQAKAASDEWKQVMETAREPMLALDGQLRVLSVNGSFCSTFKTRPEEVSARRVYELGDGQWNIPALRQLLEEILPREMSFTGFRVEHEFPVIGRRTFVLNARRMETPEGEPGKILLAMDDVTQEGKS